MITAKELTAIVRDLNSRNCARIRRLEAEAQKNGLEIKRLHDLVRRLAQRLQMARLEGFGGPDRETLLDEAREALEEDKP